MSNNQAPGGARRPSVPQEAAGATATSTSIGGAGAITNADERSAAAASAAAAKLAPHGIPVAAPPTSAAHAMAANPLLPYGYPLLLLPPPPPPHQLYPSYYSGALPIPIPPPPVPTSVFPASFYTQQQSPPVSVAAARPMAATSTQSKTAAGPTVSDSSEESDFNNANEGARQAGPVDTSMDSQLERKMKDGDDAANEPRENARSFDGGSSSPSGTSSMESKCKSADDSNVDRDANSACNSIDGDVISACNSSIDGDVISVCNSSIDGDATSTRNSIDGDAISACNSIDGSPVGDLLSLSSSHAAPDDTIGRNNSEREELVPPNGELPEFPSAGICNSAISSRAVSPILSPNDFGVAASSSSNGSPRVAARASDRTFSDDRPGELREEAVPVALAVTKKEEELPALGQERHIDEPDEFAWLRPLKCVMARGGKHPDPEKSMTNATVVSFPAPVGELLDLESRELGKCRYQEDAKWYVNVWWIMSEYKEWLPCESCRQEFGRSERSRTTTPRYTAGVSAAAKRKDLLQKSAPQKCPALGSKSRPIELDGGGDDDDDKDNNTTAVTTHSKREPASASRAPQRAKKVQASRKRKRSRRPIASSTDIFAEWEKAIVLFAERNCESSATASTAAAPSSSSRRETSNPKIASPSFQGCGVVNGESNASSAACDRLDICCECKQLEDPGSGIDVLLCDGCNAACHLPCTHDNLAKIPRNDWYCRSCWSLRESKRARADRQPATFSELQARIEQLEEENQGLKDEVGAMKQAEQVSQKELQELRCTVEASGRSSSKKCRSSAAQSSTGRRSVAKSKAETATNRKREQPKRESSGDISVRRNLLLAFLVVNDERQSDANGCGIIARRDIARGELFEDRIVTYKEGPPPPSMDQWRYISLGSNSKSTGYFRLANSLVEMINQPLKGQEANIIWYPSLYAEEGHPARKVLRIKALKDIKEGEEILVIYKSI